MFYVVSLISFVLRQMVESKNIYVTGKLIVDQVEMPTRRPESFAQRNVYGNLKIIFIKINQQKLNLFQGLAHGEKLFCFVFVSKK